MSVEGKFLSKEISELFWKENLTLATAESCTAGNVAAAITAVAGTSHFFKGGIIAYSNEVKENLLGVSHETLETYGAVSRRNRYRNGKRRDEIDEFRLRNCHFRYCRPNRRHSRQAGWHHLDCCRM